MRSCVVVGTGFGDEGKGRTVSYLCLKKANPIVVRYNGGHQAAHTVVYQDKRHVCSHYGAGVLQQVPTLYTKYCTMYPTSFIRETRALEKLTENQFGHICFDPLTPVTTPLDIIANRSNEKNLMHGTCGFGVGTTFDRIAEHHNLFFQDLFYPHVWQIKLHLIEEYYSEKFQINFSKEVPYQEKLINFKNSIESIKRLYDEGVIENSSRFLQLEDYNYIFEGAQGLMLDKTIGFFPHVTRGNATSFNAIQLIREWGLNPPDIFYVTRPYQTRHGNGPTTGIGEPTLLSIDETNKPNDYQGSLKVKQIDVDLITYAITMDKLNHTNHVGSYNLMITCIDQFENHRIDVSGGQVHVTKLELMIGHKFAHTYYSFSPETSQVLEGDFNGNSRTS